jgi:RNA polymerase sigma-B factor
MTPECVSVETDRVIVQDPPIAEPPRVSPPELPTPTREQRTRSPRTRNTSRRLQWDKKRTAELFRRYQSNDDGDARDELITMYLNLVRYLAGKYRNRGEQIDDLVQVGTIGLIKAVDRFDIERGLEFTTYATPTIIGEIKRHFRDKCWAVKVPRRLQELSTKVNGAIDAMTREYQRSPTIEEIAQHLGVNSDDVLEAIDASSAHSSSPLDVAQSGGNGETFSLLDVIGEHDPLIAAVDDRETLAVALRDVSPLAQKALYLRFFEGATQTDIARQLDISQMQVSRLLRKTLSALRARVTVSAAD